MKRFSEHLEEAENLDEGIVRTGAVGMYAARSRDAGNRAVQTYRQGIQRLSAPSRDASVEERLTRLEDAMRATLEGLAHTREQLGNIAAISVVAALLAKDGKKPR